MKNNAYSYFPAAFIIVLLAISAYLFHLTSEYKNMNRKLILENDSLLSVTHQLTHAAVQPENRDHSLAGGNKLSGEASQNIDLTNKIVSGKK